jgi:organic radical activating enzyme
MRETKSHLPELIDVKITNYCQFGCSYCYQGSTTEGLHAPKELLEEFIRQAVQAQVFEVAVGGGEPTSHPEFLTFLRSLDGCRINANFTTRNLKWLGKNLSILHRHSCAVSTDIGNIRSVLALARTVKLLAEAGDTENAITPQIVMGATTNEDFKTIIELCKSEWIMPMLLGFKTTNKGKEFAILNDNTQDYIDDDSFDALLGGDFGIDTQLAKDWKTKLKDHNVPDYYYHTHEGMCSCYVDLSHNIANSGVKPHFIPMIGSSSYHLQTMRPLTNISQQWPDLPMV